MATVGGHWQLGIGDPTPVGWLTVAGYALACWWCWRAHRRCGHHHRRFWWWLALGLAALGINKQLDLQTAFTELGRWMAHAEGWYEHRRKVQFAFIAALAVGGGAGLMALCWRAWPLSRGRALAGLGVVFLLVFVLMRASSFHHLDVFLSSTVAGLRWNWIIELSGIAAVAIGAQLECRAWRTHAPRAP